MRAVCTNPECRARVPEGRRLYHVFSSCFPPTCAVCGVFVDPDKALGFEGGLDDEMGFIFEDDPPEETPFLKLLAGFVSWVAGRATKVGPRRQPPSRRRTTRARCS